MNAPHPGVPRRRLLLSSLVAASFVIVVSHRAHAQTPAPPLPQDRPTEQPMEQRRKTRPHRTAEDGKAPPLLELALELKRFHCRRLIRCQVRHGEGMRRKIRGDWRRCWWVKHKISQVQLVQGLKPAHSIFIDVVS